MFESNMHRVYGDAYTISASYQLQEDGLYVHDLDKDGIRLLSSVEISTINTYLDTHVRAKDSVNDIAFMGNLSGYAYQKLRLEQTQADMPEVVAGRWIVTWPYLTRTPTSGSLAVRHDLFYDWVCVLKASKPQEILEYLATHLLLDELITFQEEEDAVYDYPSFHKEIRSRERERRVQRNGTIL